MTKTKNLKNIFNGNTIKVMERTVSFDKKNDDFEYVERKDVALIIPIGNDSRLIMTKQYRASLDDYIIEFPAGKINSGEDIREAAIRELREETGIVANELNQIGQFYSSPHFSDELITVFVAKELTQLQSKPTSKEHISIIELNVDNIKELINNGEILDMKSILAFYLLKSEA